MKRPILFLALAGAILAGAAACGDDGSDATPAAESTVTESAASTPTHTATSAPRPSATQPPPSPAARRTPTRPAPTPTATSPPAPPPDGTVDPMNPGDTSTKNLKPNPSTFAGPAFLVDVRMAFHPEAGGWERIVLELDSAGVPATTVGYRDPVVLCGSGEEVHVPESRAALLVEMQSTSAHDDQGEITLQNGETALPGLPGGTIVGARQTCDFEGVVAWTFGLKGERNFKISTLQDPVRVVIDIKR